MNAQPYIVFAPMCDNYAFVDQKGAEFCPACRGMLNKWVLPLDELRVRRKRSSDICSTYDGLYLVSRRFREVCETNDLTGLDFRALPRDKDFFASFSTSIVAVDTVKSRVRIEKWCPVCERWGSVTNFLPFHLRVGERLSERGFAFTDWHFACIGFYDERGPLLVCGAEAGRILMAAKLRGLTLNNGRGRYWFAGRWYPHPAYQGE